jgi:hypothetical protein
VSASGDVRVGCYLRVRDLCKENLVALGRREKTCVLDRWKALMLDLERVLCAQISGKRLDHGKASVLVLGFESCWWA